MTLKWVLPNGHSQKVPVPAPPETGAWPWLAVEVGAYRKGAVGSVYAELNRFLFVSNFRHG